ncbi:CDP-glycerol glycerophosphotransferase family protein [Brevibacterium aurantiacum]|uniref:Glycosyltransferase n=1 Tax=Brevibacterium aurantiacum TaxID=273384 RepID=A0A556C911_BREAU|nr:CDP-glycerol glycerophosphotransferase family protein [Brevibacterium aurantiacum]TSI13939.1 glycosyltransferase [Brevibacterium aurantiacum]
MKAQQWRKALWHLRHGGIKGFRDYKRKFKFTDDFTDDSAAAERVSRAGDRPTLSVVVPTFNASDFVDRCLSSILTQKGIDLEVLVVDDGSSDDTAEKAKEVAGRDGRVTVITGRNSGPAIARNRGVEAARGEYLAFVDADDEVLPNAYATMVGSLERTGSDIATGSYIRMGMMGRLRPKLTARVHARQRLAVRLDDMPELLEEPVLWNKVYQRDFWDRHVGPMKSFANYEDQEPVYRALVGAAAIDVLPADVYAWRLADGRDTRSHRKARLTDLRAKLEVIEALANVLEHEPDMVRTHAYAIWMGTDLAMHAEYLDTATDRFRKTLCSATHELKKSMPRHAWKLIPTQERLFMWVVAAGRLHDIEEILGTRLEETTAVPFEHVDGRWNVVPTFVHRLETRLPSRLLRARQVDFKPVVRVRNARWVSEGILELQGCAYVPGIDPAELAVRMQGVMDGATVFDLPVDSREDNRVDLEAGDPWRSYAAGGFTVRIDIREIDDVSPRGIGLFGVFDARDVRLSAPATSSTVVGMIAPSPMVDSQRVTVIADEHDELSISPVAIPVATVVAKNVSVNGGSITVTLSSDADVRAMELVHRGETHQLAIQNRSIFDGDLPTLPDRYLAGGERLWTLRAHKVDGQAEDVYYDSVDYLLPDTGRARPEPDIDGKVKIAQRAIRVSVTGASSDRDRLMLTGRIDPPQKLCVVLKSSDQTIAPSETTMHADGGFTTVYDLTTAGPEGGTVAALSGGYHVRFGITSESSESWARVAGKLAIRPVDVYTEWNTIRIEGRASGSVAITATPPWSSKERTTHGRFSLREQDWGPVSEGILFESFNGKSCNDNPRALFDAVRELGVKIPLYWSVRDRTVEVPAGGIPVVEGTAAWHSALATTKSWVNNNNFPYYVRKRLGQYYLQTWHGTPMKKLLWDIPSSKVPLTYRRLMNNEVQQWDVLLAQSEKAAENLRSGLGYEGEVLVGEYPRNQRLAKNLLRQETIRKRLGINPDSRVILYAPTWRERHRTGAIFRWEDYLDLPALSAQTKSTVLVRAHHVAKTRHMQKGGVIDVSTVRHVEDLLAITDVLITDYSSLLFDFRLTGRALILFAPDIYDYREERGFYDDVGEYPPHVTCQGIEEISEYCSQIFDKMCREDSDNDSFTLPPNEYQCTLDTCINLLLNFQQPYQQIEE